MTQPARSSNYRPRLVDGRLRDLLTAVLAIVITGLRAAGKTTTARQHAASEIRLDHPLQAEAFRATLTQPCRDGPSWSCSTLG